MTDTTTQPRKPGRPKKVAEPVVTTEAARLTEPAVDAVVEDVPTEGAFSPVSVLSTFQKIADALSAAGFDIGDVKGVDIRANGIARVYGTNNSLRSVRFEGWK